MIETRRPRLRLAIPPFHSTDVPRTAPDIDYLRSPETVLRLQRILDVTERLIAADSIAADSNPFSPHMTWLRSMRVYAIRLLNLKYGWRQVDILRYIGCSDSHVASMAIRLERDLPFKARPEGLDDTPPTEEWAKDTVLAIHRDYTAREDAGHAARAIRQDLIREFTGSLWIGREVADMTGLSTPAVAQIRRGSGNMKGNPGRKHRNDGNYLPRLGDASKLIPMIIGGGVRRESSYPDPLHPDLDHWYCYTPFLGHSILIAVAELHSAKLPPLRFLFPAPVKTVLRAGWRNVDGYVLCDIPYEEGVGLVTPARDTEGAQPPSNGC